MRTVRPFAWRHFDRLARLKQDVSIWRASAKKHAQQTALEHARAEAADAPLKALIVALLPDVQVSAAPVSMATTMDALKEVRRLQGRKPIERRPT